MHTSHDTGIICGNCGESKQLQRDHIQSTPLERCSVSHKLVSHILSLKFFWCSPGLGPSDVAVCSLLGTGGRCCSHSGEMHWDCWLELACVAWWWAGNLRIDCLDRHTGFVLGQHRRKIQSQPKYIFFLRQFIDKGKVLSVKSSWLRTSA